MWSARRLVKRLLYKSWPGFCPICESRVRFLALGSHYRDQLVCDSCFSIARGRAIMQTLQSLYPDWRKLKLHESSPEERSPASSKLRRESSDYTSSQYRPSEPLGAVVDGYRNENLEAQTFADETFDLVITQDVFEHLSRPDKAIAEIVRTLKPGGAHIMTVPVVRKGEASRRRASLNESEVVHHLPPEYHGNPIDPNGSLVTIDWGYDIAAYLTEHGGPTALMLIHDASLGIRDDYNAVVVTTKSPVPSV